MKPFIIAALTLLLSINAAFAISLDDAKAKGLVGERPNGYLGAVSPSPEVDSLVEEINSKRKIKYQEIAKKNGATLQSVEALAGEKAIANTVSGQYVQDKSGWKRK